MCQAWEDMINLMFLMTAIIPGEPLSYLESVKYSDLKVSQISAHVSSSKCVISLRERGGLNPEGLFSHSWNNSQFKVFKSSTVEGRMALKWAVHEILSEECTSLQATTLPHDIMNCTWGWRCISQAQPFGAWSQAQHR